MWTKEKREEYTRKDRLRGRTHTLMKNGTIKKRDCENCGESKTVAHHVNYVDPLAVKFLCRICHTKVHMGILAISIIFILSAIGIAFAGGDSHFYSDDQIADAIYIAEGGAKTAHPYGILKTYKATTSRQACINTIRHARRDWNGSGDFIAFLGSRYAPVGAANDPTNLNKNWIKNVRDILWTL